MIELIYERKGWYQIIFYVLYLDENGKKSYEIFTGNNNKKIRDDIEAFAQKMDMNVSDFIIFDDNNQSEF